MPQLNGGGGDDLGANDELISFKDEGEQEEKISENSSAERDLADVKSSLVNESETNQNSSSDSEVRNVPPLEHTCLAQLWREDCRGKVGKGGGAGRIQVTWFLPPPVVNCPVAVCFAQTFNLFSFSFFRISPTNPTCPIQSSLFPPFFVSLS